VKSQKYKFKTKNIKTFSFLLVLLAFSFSILTFNLSQANAIEMNSTQYRIQMGDVNIGAANNQESENGNLLSNTLGQIAAGQFDSDGYIVKAGFQYIHSIEPFTFSISDTNINFGEIEPNYPETATTDLSVSFGSGGEYLVTVAEQARLNTENGDYIDDACCDVGCSSVDKCTESVSALWDLNSTPGFGYKMFGEDIPTTFTTCGDKCYRPFPDTSIPEDPAVIMSSPDVTVNLASKPKDTIHQSQMTLKLNVNTGQASGTYQTILNFMATPSY